MVDDDLGFYFFLSCLFDHKEFLLDGFEGGAFLLQFFELEFFLEFVPEVVCCILRSENWFDFPGDKGLRVVFLFHLRGNNAEVRVLLFEFIVNLLVDFPDVIFIGIFFEMVDLLG